MENSKSANELYLPCSERTQLVAFGKDGGKKKVQRCGEETAEFSGLDVLPDQCNGCPVRSAITRKALDLKKYRPPLVDETHTVLSKRPDTNAPQEWPPCKDRQISVINSCCGQTMDVRVCNSVDCHRLGSSIHPGHCHECVNRVEK